MSRNKSSNYNNMQGATIKKLINTHFQCVFVAVVVQHEKIMLCYVMLCYVMLCYVMLCYVMLCYVMLC